MSIFTKDINALHPVMESSGDWGGFMSRKYPGKIRDLNLFFKK